VSSNRLIRERREVRIEPRAMQVLAYLAEHAGDVVTKEQLVQDVWEGAFVTDEALTYAVHELRKALGDDAKKPQFIETVPKKGYRLVAPVSFEDKHKVRKKVYWVAAAPLLLTAGWIFLQIYLSRSSSDLDAGRVVVAEFDNETGDESLDALGRMAADWITQGLSHTGVVKTIPTSTTLMFSPVDEDGVRVKGTARLRALAEKTGAGTVVSGAYYLQGDVLHFQASITDVASDEILHGFEPVHGPRDDAVEIIDQLRERIMGLLAGHFQTETDIFREPI
jgi:TolB-like protein